MALFRGVGFLDPGPLIQGDGVYLRSPAASDFDAWAELRLASKAFLVPWEPTWPEDDLTRFAFRRRVKRYAQEVRDDAAYAFFLFRKGDDALLGGITLSNVRRGVAQAANMGYWMGERHAGQGFMGRGVRALLPFVFETLRLHRVEAACMPTNDASIRLLERTGFTREGFARSYLRIAGEWRDHLLYARVAEEARG
jgi:[ribosomal protein S5]-alanine N-acetyltransferase